MAEHEPDETHDNEAKELETVNEPSDTQTSRDPRVADAETKRDEYLAALQRSQADYQNLRRRLQSDIDTAVGRAKNPLLQDLLLVLDYLDMALAAPVTSAEGRNLHAGVEMTKGQLVRALEREGVKAIAETGAFDAALHDAVESVATDAAAPNTILSTLRKGYTQNGVVLRPAQVKVAVAPTARAGHGKHG
jgi:molecular chaperone GrpE